MPNITIHRGQNQIGGSIIEVSSDSTRIILDIGINLDENDELIIPEIEGLFVGEGDVDAVFISHYHADHIGLIEHILPGIPVYVGETSFEILKAAKGYIRKEVSFTPDFYVDNKPIKIGDIEVIPISCDHSAYDSYMFEVECDNKKILYTGDFRANGRKDFTKLLDRLDQVDALIIEGTMLSRETYEHNITEAKLEEIGVSKLAQYAGPCFVEVSALNVDRLITLKNIAKKTNRTLLLDTYIASVMRTAGGDAPIPNIKDNIRVFLTRSDRQGEHDLLNSFGRAKIGRNGIAKLNYIMCVRSSMKKYLEKSAKTQDFSNGILFYSMWSGYQEEEGEKAFLKFMEANGVKIHKLHTSGHADTETIDKLVSNVNPKMIIPVHTENPEWYKKYDIRLITEKFIKI